MENLSTILFELLNEELNDLSIGKSYNLARINQMKEICYIAMYEQFVTLKPIDALKISKLFRYGNKI